MNIIQKTCLFFTVLGSLNWGLYGLFNFNLVSWIFGDRTIWAIIVYTLIAVCALVNILIFFIDLRNHRKDHEIHHSQNI